MMNCNSKSLALFAVQCNTTDIYNITDGRLENPAQVYKYGDTIDYSCDVGFTKTESLRCLSNKSWSTARCEEGEHIPLRSLGLVADAIFLFNFEL